MELTAAIHGLQALKEPCFVTVRECPMAMREMPGTPSLLEALDYLELLAQLRPDRVGRAAVRWHGRLELKTSLLSLTESQLALAALASLCAGEREAVEILRRLVRRARPTLAGDVGGWTP
jgi:hypothetical protein